MTSEIKNISFRHPITEDRADIIAREYEDFAYIVSHDLSAPLRHIKEFTHLLIGSREENLNDEEREYISYLKKSLQKLDEMQIALLSFSRLNTRAGEKRKIDMTIAVNGALQDLEEEIDTYRPEFSCDPLPALTVEPQQIQLLFYHLISNALKFHPNALSKRVISIKAIEHPDVWCFEVKDNGIGLDSQYHDEMFRLFRKLEPDRYPGIGIGLTIARKIVQHHNGDIYIDSQLGKGTNVICALPKP